MNDLRLITEQIKDILDLRNIIPDLHRSGNTYRRLCPFHAETEPSFYVQKQFYHCFGGACGAKGDVFNWIMETQSLDFTAALAIAADLAGVKIDSGVYERVHKASEEREETQSEHERYRQELKDNPEALSYLTDKRGLRNDVIEHFQIGYRPDWNAISIPIFNRAGKLEVIAYRFMDAKTDGERYRWSNPKYTGWRKKDNLYNVNSLFSQTDSEGPVYVAEGFFDVMTIWQAGYSRVVGMMGSSLSEAHMKELDEQKVVFVPDASKETDFDIFRRAMLRLRKTYPRLSASVAMLPDGDPNSAGVEGVQQAIANAQSAEFAILKHDLEACESQDEEYKAARNIVGQIPDVLVKDDVVKFLCSRWQKTYDVVSQALVRSDQKGVQIFSVAEAISEMERIEKDAATEGLHMAWPNLRKFITRPHTGQLLLFVGRTAVGKTMWALNYIHQTKLNEIPTLFISFEQPVTELVQRLMTMVSPDIDVPMTQVELSNAIINDTEEYDAIKILTQIYYPHLLFVDKILDASQIKDAITDASYLLGQAIKVVIIDHTGLMKTDRGRDSYERMSQIYRDIQGVTKEMNVLTIAIGQLSREGAAGTKRVTFDMIRDTGVAEETADYIIGTWRENEDDEMVHPGLSKMFFTVCKNRHGKCGEGLLYFDVNHLLIDDQPQWLDKRPEVEGLPQNF